LKDKLVEKEVLESVLKARYETLSKNAIETREDFEKLALKRVKEKRKMKKIIRQNYKLWKIPRYLKVKIKLLTTKSTTHLDLEVLATAAENLHEDASS